MTYRWTNRITLGLTYRIAENDGHPCKGGDGVSEFRICCIERGGAASRRELGWVARLPLSRYATFVIPGADLQSGEAIRDSLN